METNQNEAKRASVRQASCGYAAVSQKAKRNQIWEVNMRQVSRACDAFWTGRGLPKPTRVITFESTSNYWSTPTEI